MSIPTVNVSLNSCQKICVSASTVCIEESPYSWTTTTPSLVTLNSSGLNCLIAAKPNVSGIATVVLSNYVANPVLYIVVTITNYTSLVFSTSGTNFLLSTTVVSPATPPNNNPYQISGPFNSLASPLDPNLTYFVWNQSPSTGFTDQLNITNFIPGTVSRVTALPTSIGAGATNFGLLMFQRTLDPFLNPLYPIVTRVSVPKPAPAVFIINCDFNGLLPCTYTSYLPFAQYTSAQIAPTTIRIYGSVMNSSNRSIDVITETNIQNFNQPIEMSMMICPKGYLNTSNVGLMWCDTVNVTIALALNAVISVPLPVNIPGFATSVVFAQPYSITPNSTNVRGILLIRSSVMTSATAISLNVFNSTNVQFTVPISFFVFSKTVTSGYTFV